MTLLCRGYWDIFPAAAVELALMHPTVSIIRVTSYSSLVIFFKEVEIGCKTEENFVPVNLKQLQFT